MSKRALLMMLACAGLLAACQTPRGTACDGVERLTPAANTRQYIIANDRPFAQQVAAHNTYLGKAGCK